MPRAPDVIYQTELVYRYIEQAVVEVGITSADRFYAWMRQNNLPVTRAVVRENWREYMEKREYRPLIERWPEDKPIPRAWIVERESTVADKYVARFTISTTEPKTGATLTTHMYVGVNRQPRKEDLLERLLYLMGTSRPDIDMTEATASIDFIAHVKGREW